jgi:GDP-L-fucose synthase
MKATLFGSSGLLGREVLHVRPVNFEVFCPTSSMIDLESLIPSSNCNDVWFNCAAKVGGVQANIEQVSDFYNVNSRINNNVFEGAHLKNVKKLVSVMSTCIYPDSNYVKYPLTEDQLHNGPPHLSNFGYAYAKRMMDIQSRAYRQQYGCNYVTVIPNNLYGLRDNYDVNNGHVIPSLIRKFYEAKQSGGDVTIWGSGKPLREFTFARDAAKIMWWIAENYDGSTPVNIGCTDEISIGDLATLIGKLIGFKGKIKFDSKKPDGQLRKPSSNEKLKKLGCDIEYTKLNVGLEETIEYFCKNYPKLRGVEKV